MRDLAPENGASLQVKVVAVFLCKTVGVVLRWFESITRHHQPKRPLTRQDSGAVDRLSSRHQPSRPICGPPRGIHGVDLGHLRANLWLSSEVSTSS
jgi:hypothetical protein